MRAVFEQFEGWGGGYSSGAPYGSGHINDTYQVTFSRYGRTGRCILQRVNHYVFKNIPELMENIERVCVHARRKLVEAGWQDAGRRALTLIPAKDGLSFCRDAEGCFWRAYEFIEGASGRNSVTDIRQAFEAAKAFGQFQKLLADLPGRRLNETIPGFHNTRNRLAALDAAIAADKLNRAAGCRMEIEWAMASRQLASALLDLHERGLMPERATHNDTKLNNVLIDDKTNEAVCVIDLDTMMPGLALYDFGDLVRSSANPAAEDELDLSKVFMRLDVFEALARGYLFSARDCLTDTEVSSLAVSAMVMTFECGMRFLTDYLEGDVYFKTRRPGQNIDRCRCQFALVRSMMDQKEAMESCVSAAIG